MKFAWLSYFLTIFLAVAVLGLLFWFEDPVVTPSVFQFSPIPSFLTLFDNSQVTSLDIWQSQIPKVQFFPNAPVLSATSAFAYDLTTDKVLLNKNANKRAPMASLTKIMTAIVALEHKKADDTYRVSGKDLVGEDSMGLDAGEELSLDELLYGMLLHSGNDAAQTLATNFPGGSDAFVDAMNLKAQSLGLTNTHFTNPTGLSGDGNQFTTAEDLVVMSRYALSHFPLFSQIVSTFDYVIPATATHKEYDLENETNLLSSYPGVKGVKDGYTPEAGLCLVTYLEYSGHKIIAVLLGSDDRRGEMKEVLDYSLKSLGITPPRHG